MNSQFVSPDHIRSQFSRAMSDMYRTEVPLYGDLLDLVADVNAETLAAQPALSAQLTRTGEIERLDIERHGAIRLGTAQELSDMRRVFAVMGMEAVGYYDLSTAGVPVHSTAFRAVHEASLQVSPFRVFTSLLRLELIEDPDVRAKAADVLAARKIFTPRALALAAQYEARSGLTEQEAQAFVQEVLHTFRWHSEAAVSLDEYNALLEQHRLVADVVAFKGPHINHLTPRTLDIDAAQKAMGARGMASKAVIEGPPTRKCPILLRQTSFKALEEPVSFIDADGQVSVGSHTARFGEIEQRGVALTPEGRALYDTLLAEARAAGGAYETNLSQCFERFPDDYATLRDQNLAFFRYFATDKAEQGQFADDARLATGQSDADVRTALASLIEQGFVNVEPLVYEDFLPVSAAGIFQSNLGDDAKVEYTADASQAAFEQALGASVHDELTLYASAQARSVQACVAYLRGEVSAQAEATV